MKRKITPFMIILGALLTATLACNMPRRGAPTPFPTQEVPAKVSATFALPTATKIAPPSPTLTATIAVPPTLVPTTAVPPTVAVVATPLPTVAVPGAYQSPVAPPAPNQPPPYQPPPATVIKMQAGATSASVTGGIAKGQAANYSLKALAGQTMMVTVLSPHNNVYLGITGEGGSVLQSTVFQQPNFSGLLPATTNYILTLYSPYESTNYSMEVIIPVRIRFAPGAVGDSVQGSVAASSVNHYLLRASQGQTMIVNLISPRNDVALTIYGVDDGIPLVRAASGASDWMGVLPATQDYMIMVVSTGRATDYVLNVSVK